MEPEKQNRIKSTAYLPLLEAAIFGFAVGASAVALSMGVDALGTLRVSLSAKYNPLIVLPAFGLIGGTIAGLLVQRVAPEASGSGIPQVRAALDRVKMPLDWRIAIVKLVGGTIALGSGLFMGREGPTVQLGAALAATMTKLTPGINRYRRQLIASGAGAGLAAAFNAPLAGAVFVLEELLKEMKASTVVIALAASSAAALAVQLLWPESLANHGGHGAAQISSEQIFFLPRDLPFYILLAFVAAVCGRLFNDGILFSLNLYRRITNWPISIKVGLAGLFTGLIIALTPESFHDYALLRGLIVTGAEGWPVVLFALFEFYVLAIMAYGSGAPGGLFAPSLAIGASLGFLVGTLENLILPAFIPGILPGVTTGTMFASTAAFSLVGMGAFFASVARVPLTAIVITFELTGNFNLLVPLMITCLLASAFGEIVSKGSLYERLMEWNGLFLQRPGESAEEAAVLKITVKDLMQTEQRTIGSQEPVRDLLELFSEGHYQGMAVVDAGQLVGVMRQENLASLLHVEKAENDSQTPSKSQPEAITIAQVMTVRPVSVSPEENLDEILHLFTHHHYNWLPVTENDRHLNDRYLGVIFQNDVIKALFGKS